MKHIVGVSEMKISSTPSDVIVTYALGSCIGIAIHDPILKIGGILHFMLPESKIDKEKSQKNPLMFGDTGIPFIFNKLYELGSKKNSLRVIMVGGASVVNTNDTFNIGKRNTVIARKLFWKNNIMIDAEHIGDTVPRTLYLEIGSGNCWITIKGKRIDL